LSSEKNELQSQITTLKDNLLDAERLIGDLKASHAALTGSQEGRKDELVRVNQQLVDKLEDRREKAIKAREVYTYTTVSSKVRMLILSLKTSTSRSKTRQ
jgi:predicted  nucleic acid-binding Zn-ribbon protein